MARFEKGKSGNIARQFRPGWAGGPGRPKKRPITDEYFRLADQPLPGSVRKKIKKRWGLELPPEITWSKAAAIRRYLDALEPGGVQAGKEIREAIEGKSPQRLEISGPERKQVTIKVVYDRKKPASEESKENAPSNSHRNCPAGVVSSVAGGISDLSHPEMN
jgi:hypothetical protein